MFKEYKIQDQRCEKELERGRTNPWKDPDIIWTKHYQQSKFFAFKLIQNNSSLICCRIKTEQNTNPNYRNECEKWVFFIPFISLFFVLNWMKNTPFFITFLTE